MIERPRADDGRGSAGIDGERTGGAIWTFLAYRGRASDGLAKGWRGNSGFQQQDSRARGEKREGWGHRPAEVACASTGGTEEDSGGEQRWSADAGTGRAWQAAERAVERVLAKAATGLEQA